MHFESLVALEAGRMGLARQLSAGLGAVSRAITTGRRRALV